MRKLLLILVCLFVSVLSIEWHDMSECISFEMFRRDCQKEREACDSDKNCEEAKEKVNPCAQNCVDNLPEGSEFPFTCVDACIDKGSLTFKNLYVCAKNVCLTIYPKLKFLE
jgi:hypothetical protein